MEKPKTIGMKFLKICGAVINSNNEEFCEIIKPRLLEVYVDLKRMSVKLAKLENGGKLPNPDSEGWKEEFWVARFNQAVKRKDSMKRIRAKIIAEEAVIDEGKKILSEQSGN